MSSKYASKTELITSSISGGRLHHSFRPLVKALETYDYATSFGENFHTLSALIFDSDELYWMLQDINPPKDAFNFSAGDIVKLPLEMLRDTTGIDKFF